MQYVGVSPTPSEQPQVPSMSTEQKTAFDLGLISQEQLGNIIFLIGILIGIASGNEGAKALLEQQQQKKQALTNDALKLLVIISWLYFIASIIFAYVGVIRQNELQASTTESSSTADKVFLNADAFAAAGGVIKAVGFGITAVGNQIKYNTKNTAGS